MTTPSLWEKPGTLAEQLWRTGKAGCPIYDMHGHMGCHNAIFMKIHTPEQAAAHLRRIGVTRLVFSHHASLWGCRRCVRDWEVCREFPDLYRMYVGINPNYPDRVREDLAEFDRWRPYAIGLKILADYHKVPVTDPRYEYALKFADERGLPVLFHTWGHSQFNGGAQMLELVRRYHRIRFFLGHTIHGEWDYAIRCVKEAPDRVYCELTAIPGQTGLVEMLCREVGSERILFGTDMPWFDEYQVAGGVVSAAISEDDMKNIFYRNIEKLLGKDF